jgi:hypothetical protein
MLVESRENIRCVRYVLLGLQTFLTNLVVTTESIQLSTLNAQTRLLFFTQTPVLQSILVHLHITNLGKFIPNNMYFIII